MSIDIGVNRLSLLRPLWLVAWPVRAYWLHSDRKIGKRLVLERIIKPLLPPPPRGFEAQVPGGARVHLYYQEDLGLTTLLGGGFERTELELELRLARPATTAVDVGANVGLHTSVLASAVGPGGHVLAFEPEPSNCSRLQENVVRNGFTNVEIHRVALQDRPGHAVLHLGADPMYHSTGTIFEDRAAGRDIVVEARILDDVWREAGSPSVSFVKIDTEGTEFEVLKGTERLLDAERPALLIETRDPRIEPWLAAWGYVGRRPRGFALGNVLFEPAVAPHRLA